MLLDVQVWQTGFVYFFMLLQANSAGLKSLYDRPEQLLH